MPTLTGAGPVFQPIAPAEFSRLATLQLDHCERFLEPLADILGFVRRGAAHRLVGILDQGRLAGFFVVHPDRRDRACWWLGWLAIDARHQGLGLGRAAVLAALSRLRRIAGCRRVRLLVAPDNVAARRLYERAGFVVCDDWPATGELVMELAQHAGIPCEDRPDVALNAYSLVQAMWLRLWRRGAPPAAQLSGEFHGPPGAAWVQPGVA